jgi:hypothetical protein
MQLYEATGGLIGSKAEKIKQVRIASDFRRVLKSSLPGRIGKMEKIGR